MQSQPWRSVSWCQMLTASWPSTGPTARRQSLSLQVPGKTTTPNFMRLALDPFLAVFGDLFLPDGHGGLERVYGVAAGLEGLAAVGAGDDDDDAALADLQPADAVDHRHAVGAPAALDLGGDGGHLALGHLGVRLVFEVADALALVVVAHDAEEGDDAADGGVLDGAPQLGHRGVVQRVA